MTGPSLRRRDPEPLGRGGELALAVAGGGLIVVVLAALGGLGVAAELWGGGWVWPRSTEAITAVVAGLLDGEPGKGLAPDQRSLVAGTTVSYACVALFESALVSGAAVAGAWVIRYRRPGDARGGMATRREAEQALGVRQLRAGRAVIRPDLHRRH